MDRKGAEYVLVKIVYVILFLLVVFMIFYFYKTKLKEGVFRF